MPSWRIYMNYDICWEARREHRAVFYSLRFPGVLDDYIIQLAHTILVIRCNHLDCVFFIYIETYIYIIPRQQTSYKEALKRENNLPHTMHPSLRA